MLQLNYDKILETIQQKSEISRDELETRVLEKQKQLGGLVSKEGAAHIVANELKISLMEKKASGRKTISELVPGMRGVEVAGKVYQKYDLRTFTRQNNDGSVREGKVASFVLADGSGFSRVTLWNDMAEKINDLALGSIVLVQEGSAKNNNGRCEIHCNDNSRIIMDPEGITINAPEPRDSANRPADEEKKIKDLKEGDENVAVTAHIVQSYEPRFYEVCPTCGKRARLREDQNVCEVHGPVTPSYGYVLNAVIDDGTETIRCVLFRNQVERLFGISREDVLGMRTQPGAYAHYESQIIGLPLKITGRIQKNSMYDRIELVAQRIYVNGKASPTQKAPVSTVLDSTEGSASVEISITERAAPVTLERDDSEDSVPASEISLEELQGSVKPQIVETVEDIQSTENVQSVESVTNVETIEEKKETEEPAASPTDSSALSAKHTNTEVVQDDHDIMDVTIDEI